jgi:catalase
MHCKAIAADDEGEELLNATHARDFKDDGAICINASPEVFIKAIALHRNWKRMEKAKAIAV